MKQGSSDTDTASSSTVIARQAIFDTSDKVIGYELLCRPVRRKTDGDVLPPSRILADCLAYGIDFVVNTIKTRQKLFINVSLPFLAAGKYRLLPHNKFVLGVAEHEVSNKTFPELLSQVKSQGYSLVSDDVGRPERLKKILSSLDYVKVDFQVLRDQKTITDVTRYLQKHKVQLLADKVESYDVVDYAKSLGYAFFQGFFFSSPQLVNGKIISPNNAVCFNLLYELNKNFLDYDRIADLIVSDPVLSLKLLRFVNSPFYGQGGSVTSIRRALMVLGQAEFLQWINVNILTKCISTDADRELVYMAAFRCRFLSKLRQLVPATCDMELDMCLPGLFSTLEAILKMPFADTFSQVQCLETVKARVSDRQSRCGDCIRLADGFERNDRKTIERSKEVFRQVDLDSINLDAHMWASCILK